MRKSFFQFIVSLLAMVTTFNMTASAGSTTTYYSQLTAKSVGSGKVYVAKPGETGTPAESAYQTDHTPTVYSVESTTTHNYKVYAKAGDGMRFMGWYNDVNCTDLRSTDNPYTYPLTASGTSQDAATKATVYAKFETYVPDQYSTLSVLSSGNEKVAITMKATDTKSYSNNPTASKTAPGSHTYYLSVINDDDYSQAFYGWYADDAYTELLSTAQDFVYTVDDPSLDSSAPTAIEIYTLFDERNPYQFNNAGFEIWNEAVTEPTPGWNSFPSAGGSLANMASSGLDAIRAEGRTGYAAKIVSVSKVGVGANGNLTTGRINAGSMSAADASGNYAYSDINNAKYNLMFSGQPDAIEFYTKFTAASNNQNGCGNAQLYIHTTFDTFQDPITDAKAEAQAAATIASANQKIMPSDDWALNHIDLTYNDAWGVEEATDADKYVLFTVTTNPTPGQSYGDELVIDDIAFIYNSEMTSLIYDGVEYTGTTLAVKGKFNINKLTVNTNARAAEVKTEYADGTLTVTVTGEDYEYNPTNQHIYEITVKELFDVTYIVEGTVVRTDTGLEVGDALPEAPDAEEREGYTFAWGEIPGTMPAEDVTITGTYTVNQYTLTVELDGTTTADYQLDYGTPIVLADYVENLDLGWKMRTAETTTEIPATMPAYDITIFNSIETGISTARPAVTIDGAYDLTGRRVGSARSGLYIIGGKKVVY